MAVNLEKYNEPGSLRGLGESFGGQRPHQLPVAARSADVLLAATTCQGFRLSRIKADSVLVLHDPPASYYVYVHPEYCAYRRVMQLRFGHIPSDHDVDHLHGRALAGWLGYRYVLLALVPERINRLHGQYERARNLPADIASAPDICLADIRILDKALRFNSETRRGLDGDNYKLQPAASSGLGLTSAQTGRWSLALGFNRAAPAAFLRRLRPW